MSEALADFELPSDAIPDVSEGGVGLPESSLRALRFGALGAGVVLLEALLLWVGVTGFFSLRPPEGLNVKIVLPSSVKAGSSFPLTVQIRNEGTEPFTVHALSVRKPLLEHLILEDPAPASPGPVIRFSGITWPYDHELAAGSTWTVTIPARSKHVGEIKGALEVQAGAFPKAIPFSIKAR